MRTETEQLRRVKEILQKNVEGQSRPRCLTILRKRKRRPHVKPGMRWNVLGHAARAYERARSEDAEFKSPRKKGAKSRVGLGALVELEMAGIISCRLFLPPSKPLTWPTTSL